MEESSNVSVLVYWWSMGIMGLVILIPTVLSLLKPIMRKKQANRVLEAKGEDFDAILSLRNSYYARLPEHLKQRFLQRTVVFMRSKEFRFVNLPPDPEAPLLVSAAAVQVSFGLSNFLMAHFPVIFILKEDYRYGRFQQPFMGHVDHQGIYLTWNNFKKGFENYGDACNVGLHEMAHALAYVNFSAARAGADPYFRKQFRQFSRVAKPIFLSMQAGTPTFLDPYAATNYHEFWAVCVENFFEKSAEFERELPELYQAIARLLAQNPLQPADLLLLHPDSSELNNPLAKSG
jgi:Mlc titration factor MtfA (ptsG expression regulator)